MKSIIAYGEIEATLADLPGKKILIGGCFDVLHIGHIRFIDSAKRQGDQLIVALESDEFIKKRKNKIPFHTQTERAEMLAALSMVDLVIILPFLKTDADYLRLVERIKPDVIAVTTGDSQLKNKQKHAATSGAIVKQVIKPQKNRSTTKIKAHYSVVD